MKLSFVSRSALSVVLALQLSACSMPKFFKFEGSRLNWDSVVLSAAANANKNSAVAVDVVLALDASMVQRLQELTADKWFAGRTDLQKTFPASVHYFAWELVPGQTLRISGDTLERPRVIAAFAFASYATQGHNRQRIESLKNDLVIRLDEKSFEVISAP